MARTVDAEVARDDRGPAQHIGGGQTFGHEPVFQLGVDGSVIFRQRLDLDDDRGQPRARRLPQPIGRKHVEGARVEGAFGQTGFETGIGDEFGMAFPFHDLPPQFGSVMRGIGRGMACPVPVEQVKQMRPVARAVALGGFRGRLDGHEHGRRWHADAGGRTGMQLVDKSVTVRVIGNRGHGRHLSGCPCHILHCRRCKSTASARIGTLTNRPHCPKARGRPEGRPPA